MIDRITTGMSGTPLRLRIIQYGINIHSLQQTIDTINKYRQVMFVNTITSFWNISTASAPIPIQKTRVK